MNYHYIDFMIKERQRLELEDCQRRRMLRTVREQNSSSRELGIVPVLKDIYVRVRTIFLREQNISETTLFRPTKIETARKI